MMKSIFTVLVLIISIIYSNSSNAQSLKDSIQELDSYFLQVMEDWRIPSMAIGVVKGNEIVFLKGYGFRDIDKKLPVDENTLFPIDGIDNTIVEASIGVLQDQGKINLNKPLKLYLPDLTMYDDYVSNHITMHDFMTSKTGLASHGYLWFGTDYSRDTVIKSLAFLEPVTGFRETSSTALSYYVAKYAVDQISGSSYERFVQQYLLKPLEMNTTCFGFEFEKQDNVALPYDYNPVSEKYDLSMNWFRDLLNVYNANNNPGVFSSAKEMCNWMIMNLNGGKFKGKQIVSTDFISQTQSVIVPSGSNDYSNGHINLGKSFGSYIDFFHGSHLVISYGHKGMFDSTLMLFPQDSIGIIVLTGSTFSGRWIITEVLAEKIFLGDYKDWNQVGLNNPRWVNEMANKPEPERPTGLNESDPPSLKLKSYAGRYSNKGYGEITIWEELGQLKGKRSVTEYELDHIGKDRFKIHVRDTYLNFKTMQFHVDENGELNKLSVDFESALPPIEFMRVKQKAKSGIGLH